MTRMILTSCHTHSVQCSQTILPCNHCNANQTSAECCLEFTTGGGYRMFLGLPGSALPPPNGAGSSVTLHTAMSNGYRAHI